MEDNETLIAELDELNEKRTQGDWVYHVDKYRSKRITRCFGVAVPREIAKAAIAEYEKTLPSHADIAGALDQYLTTETATIAADKIHNLIKGGE